MALARQAYQNLLFINGNDSQRGKTYVQSLLKELWHTSPSLIPYALLQSLAKWSGYRLGQISTNAPIWWKKIWSSQKFYWDF